MHSLVRRSELLVLRAGAPPGSQSLLQCVMRGLPSCGCTPSPTLQWLECLEHRPRWWQPLWIQHICVLCSKCLGRSSQEPLNTKNVRNISWLGLVLWVIASRLALTWHEWGCGGQFWDVTTEVKSSSGGHRIQPPSKEAKWDLKPISEAPPD